MRIEVENLGKSVKVGEDSLTILDGVSFVVNPGETLAVLGSSGSGKSTLLGLIAGLDTPSTGRVRLAGQDIFALDEDGRANLRGHGMGFVFQSFQLLHDLTALENVMLPLELSGVADARERARAQLALVGLGHRERHRPNQLSGGEQQRVALARAFATSPSLLLADEPTGNLDPHTGARIIDLMLDLNHAGNTTLIVVTHDPALAGRCDRQVRLEAGRLT